MSDTDSDADSMSDSSNAHFYAGGAEDYIPVDARGICNQLRTNDPRVLDSDSVFSPSNYVPDKVQTAAVTSGFASNTTLRDVDLRACERPNSLQR